jgi:hypothetical protein
MTRRIDEPYSKTELTGRIESIGIISAYHLRSCDIKSN